MKPEQRKSFAAFLRKQVHPKKPEEKPKSRQKPRQNVETAPKETTKKATDVLTPGISEHASSSLASPLIGNTNVTNDKIALFNQKMISEELNRDVL